MVSVVVHFRLSLSIMSFRTPDFLFLLDADIPELCIANFDLGMQVIVILWNYRYHSNCKSLSDRLYI